MKPYNPDWKNAANYPPIGCSDKKRLAWEFLRRNAAYAKDVALLTPFVETGEFFEGFKTKSKSCLNGVVCYPEAIPDETVQQFYKRMRIAKVKRCRIDKPANTFQRRWNLKRPVSPEIEFESGLVEFDFTNVRLVRNNEFKSKNFALILHPNEAAVRFSLELPLVSQIEQATNMLEVATQEYKKSLKKLKGIEQKIFVAIASTKLRDEVFEDAHYWLRCFDANYLPVEETGNPKARRELKNGPKARLKVFNGEITQFTALNKEAILSGRIPKRDYFVDGALKSFLESVTPFINNKKYQKLFDDERDCME